MNANSYDRKCWKNTYLISDFCVSQTTFYISIFRKSESVHYILGQGIGTALSKQCKAFLER